MVWSFHQGTELIFVTSITNYICGEKIVMWRNFVNKWEILGDFATIYALSCGEKLSPKSIFVEKKCLLLRTLSLTLIVVPALND